MTLVALVSISLLIFSFSIKTTILTQAQCLPNQRYALIQLKEGFNTTELHSWNASTDCCIWDGISCNKQTGMVTEVDLTGLFISGKINPASIKNLTRLKYLSFGSNRLIGTIPMSLFSHPSLVSLDLGDNQFSGYLPEFSNVSSILRFIFLEYNNLEGRLPNSIFKFPQLVMLVVDSNNFTGTLNLDLIKLNKKLNSLDLSNNKLSIIEGKNNNESFYASFPQMTELLLESCNLTKFPSFLRYQTNIDTLDLSANRIDGIIPNWLSIKTSITYLNLSHNFFTEIEGDAYFTSLDRLKVLDIHSNRISGSVPLLPQGVEYVDLSSNYLSLPAYFVSSLNYLYLSNNSLTGDIPNSICNTTFLQMVDLSYNNLTGTMPPCLLEYAELEQH